MKPRRALLLTAVSLLLLFAAFVNDDDSVSVLVKKLDAFNITHPQEKVHLHLDKPYYAVGDDIWFKAYILNVNDSRLSELSGLLNVELINDRDSILQYRKLPVENGLTWGDFKLPDSLTEGNYRIRAYTQLMRNQGPEFFYDKTIKVGNAWTNKVYVTANYTYSKEKALNKVDATLQFKDNKDNAYQENAVSYEVLLDGRSVERGKAKTNASGEINLSFTNAQNKAFNSGRIVADMILPKKDKIRKEIRIKSISSNVDVQFFPEGGDLVAGIPSKLAIKSVNAQGLGENISGVIVDNDGAVLTDFKTSYLGMGMLVLSPEKGKSYTAKVKFADGSEKNYPLPAFKPEGYVLSVNNVDTSKVQVKVYVSSGLLNNDELKLLVQHGGNIEFVYKTKAKTQVAAFTIPKKDLPSGIIQLTLFSGQNTPLCERLLFIKNPADRLETMITGPSAIYNKRAALNLDLNSLDNGKATQGDYSVSVTNADVVKTDLNNESNILTSFLLTSDLKGYVEKPNHYFLDNSPQTNAELDNLLLTQGWRRFSWQDVISGTKPGVYLAEKNIEISGSLLTLGGKPMPNAKVSLFSSDGGFFMTDTLSDANGRFSFDKLSFNDGTKFIVQARNLKGKKNVEIKLNLLPEQAVTKNEHTGDIEVNVNESISSYIKSSNSYFDEMLKQGLLKHSISLNEVAIKGKKPVESKSRNLNGAGNADQTITAKNFETCVNLLTCLQGRVGGLMIRSNVPYLLRSQGRPMLVLIDGMEVDSDRLSDFSGSDIETVEVLKSTAYTSIYGGRGSGGVLIITTKTGNGASYNNYTPWIATLKPKGFPEFRSFYSPVYTTTTTDNVKDLRTTVYWNPEVRTDVNGKAKINFFTTDQAGNYRVVVEGINGSGQLGRTVYNYKVK
jgi:TonB-dependent SusC/RagA subfamily outer membrane receptor